MRIDGGPLQCSPAAGTRQAYHSFAGTQDWHAGSQPGSHAGEAFFAPGALCAIKMGLRRVFLSDPAQGDVSLGEVGRRLARGERAAFAELYDLCADRLHHYLVVRLGSRADADDVLQETFVRLARTRRKLAGVENPTAYLFAIARNEAMRLLAGRTRDQRAYAKIDANQLYREAVGDDLEAREAAVALAEALALLPDEQREVVELKTYAGLTLDEISKITGTPAGTVATRYRAGIEKLKQSLTRKCRE
jgi:RNA polymerase sigma-70 factor, ECF subfamily